MPTRRGRENLCQIQMIISSQHQVCLCLYLHILIITHDFHIFTKVFAGISFRDLHLFFLTSFVFVVSEVSDGQKRRRLEAAGQENWSPKPSSSGRLAELETKPDTPMVPSVRSRVQLLTQRRDGNCSSYS